MLPCISQSTQRSCIDLCHATYVCAFVAIYLAVMHAVAVLMLAGMFTYVAGLPLPHIPLRALNGMLCFTCRHIFENRLNEPNKDPVSLRYSACGREWDLAAGQPRGLDICHCGHTYQQRPLQHVSTTICWCDRNGIRQGLLVVQLRDPIRGRKQTSAKRHIPCSVQSVFRKYLQAKHSMPCNGTRGRGSPATYTSHPASRLLLHHS